MKELTLDAVIENIDVVTDLVNEELEAMDCPMKAQIQIDVAIDEIFNNISSYAYPEGAGQATVRVEELAEPHGMRITFLDEGIPFDPTAKEDPNVSLSAEERGVGGLGIFMVKKSMDAMTYRREDGKNILALDKHF